MYLVRKEFDYNVVGSYRRADPFTIMTVFPHDGAPFVLKGGANDIENWIKSWKKPCMVRYSYWKHGRSWGWNDI